MLAHIECRRHAQARQWECGEKPIFHERRFYTGLFGRLCVIGTGASCLRSLQPVNQQDTHSDCCLVRVVVDQGFAITVERLDIAHKPSLYRKTPRALQRTDTVVVPSEQGKLLPSRVIDCRDIAMAHVMHDVWIVIGRGILLQPVPWPYEQCKISSLEP